ncbi:MAG TPA: sulfatase [Planctomycetota bacterium]|nr:sulfatase [Planctomycetota bacterium]
MLRVLVLLLLLVSCGLKAADAKPNFVLIFCDDLGYRDISCFGSPIKTPHIDRLASEGVRFTDFYVSQAVCSASRAALLSGCYSNRVSIRGALGPTARNGINPDEKLIPEVLKERGYATAIFGKWHLGHLRPFLPLQHGFDEYLGLPYSNDMQPENPHGKYPPLPLIDGNDVKENNPDQRNLTTWYTERAVQFIRKNKEKPFFLYVPHSMPHVPLFVSDKHKDKSGQGLYGDVIAEIDWSVGEILKTLKEQGLDEKTLVVFTSDNGPWLVYGDHAGSALPLREGKATTMDGGMRVPCVMRWPGKIPAGTICKELACTMDLLPTFAKLAGGAAPTDRIIDGKDIWPLMSAQPDAKSAHEAFYYYWLDELQAVRSGKWKLHAPHAYLTITEPGKDGIRGKGANRQIGGELFDLENDVGETTDVAAKYPEIVKKLEAYLEAAREDLGDSRTSRKGKNVRPAGKLENDK